MEKRPRTQRNKPKRPKSTKKVSKSADKKPKESETVDIEDYQCIICFDLLYKPTRSPCKKHFFCFYCLKKWKQTKECCPLCMEEFPSDYKVKVEISPIS